MLTTEEYRQRFFEENRRKTNHPYATRDEANAAAKAIYAKSYRKELYSLYDWNLPRPIEFRTLGIIAASTAVIVPVAVLVGKSVLRSSKSIR